MKIFLKIKNLFWPTKENNNQPLILTDRVISVLILLFLLVKVLFSFEILILRQTSLFAEVSAQKILELTNDLRKQYGLPPLNENPLLKEAAKEKALDMIKNKYFAHHSPTGISPWYFIEKSGYDYHYAGENLAMNFIDSEEVVRAWINSPTHRDNLLNQKYKEIGIAVLSGDITGDNISKIIVVQMFGSQIKKPTSLTKVAQAEENVKIPPAQITISSTKPVSKKIAQIEGTKIQETTTSLSSPSLAPLTTTLEPTTTAEQTTTTLAPVISRAEENNSQSLTQGKFSRDKINAFNQIVAFVLISLGTIVLLGIVINQRKGYVHLVYSELVIRGALVILIGFAFLLFKMEIFIGHLAIA
ncbi:MAG: CAP domain-containing protein [Minisyncoccia bacterium]